MSLLEIDTRASRTRDEWVRVMEDIGTRPRSFGVEEEYLLLDATNGTPVNSAAEVIFATPELGEKTEREFLSSQLETATPICHEAEEAEVALSTFRKTVAQAATSCGVVLAGTGLPPLGGEAVATVTPKPRYQLIASETRNVGKHQYSTGTHVHVEVPSPDAGVDVLARLARWAPALLAMTANSPLWCEEPTGFASWRHVMGLSWPVAGYPQDFEDSEDYALCGAALIESGVVPDAGMLSWVARLSANYPTVELRIADSQLKATDAVAFAIIVRALVDHALTEAERGEERPRYRPGIVNGANWIAARNGMSSELIDPLRARSIPAFDLVESMLFTVETELERFGDRERVESFVQRLRDEGDPATRQLAAFESEGVEGLIGLYRMA